MGNMSGPLKDGLNMDFNIFQARGFVKFYIRNGEAMWVGMDIKIVYNGHYEGDYKMITF